MRAFLCGAGGCSGNSTGVISPLLPATNAFLGPYEAAGGTQLRPSYTT